MTGSCLRKGAVQVGQVQNVPKECIFPNGTDNVLSASTVNMFKNTIATYFRKAGYMQISQCTSLSACHLGGNLAVKTHKYTHPCTSTNKSC